MREPHRQAFVYLPLLVAAACNQQTLESYPSTSSSTTAAHGFKLIDTSPFPSWIATTGMVFSADLQVVDDLTGDGVADAVVPMSPEKGGPVTLYIVAGPLRRSLQLPGDEVASLPDAGGLLAAGDATGDGTTDLVVVGIFMSDEGTGGELVPTSGTFIVQGPFLGVMSATNAGTRLSGAMDYVDGDNVLDLYTLLSTGQGTDLGLTWGPIEGPAPAPDLVVHASCPNNPERGFASPRYFRSVGDPNGDSTLDLQLGDTDWSCSTWSFPLPTSGSLILDKDPAAVYGAPMLVSVPDQTGDGVPDEIGVGVAGDRAVYSWPMQLEQDGTVTAAIAIPLPALADLAALAFDLTGDGISDWIGVDMEIDPSEIVGPTTGPVSSILGASLVRIPGGSAVSEPAYDQAWDVQGMWVASSRGSFEEDGMVSVLAGDHGHVVVIDLGPDLGAE